MELRADCERCFGLCCVAPAFVASADFAIDKAPGRPCPNLGSDFRCGIHDRLRPSGFTGCAVYDCFGAGQRVARAFAGRDWRARPETAPAMFGMFTALRHLHELLWYLAEAARLPAAAPIRAELAGAYAETESLASGEPDAVRAVDVAAQRDRVNPLLVRASELARAGMAGRGPGRGRASRTDLIGANLRGADLRGANLRGTCLIGADLRRADLRLADVTGADLRGARLAGADLSRTLFLTQAQLEAATGDTATRLPVERVRPAHWPAARRAPTR
jgi:hypothetical protein